MTDRHYHLRTASASGVRDRLQLALYLAAPGPAKRAVAVEPIQA
jgi:hypothetical protein